MEENGDFKSKALAVFDVLDFSTVRPIASAWDDFEGDVPEVNKPARRRVERQVRLAASNAAGQILALPVVGPAGSGKTHLMNHLRRRTLEAGGSFVLANMETATDFWATMMLNYRTSLQRAWEGGRTQLAILIETMMAAAGTSVPEPLGDFLFLGTADELAGLASRIWEGIHSSQILRGEAGPWPDLIRALVFLGSINVDISDFAKLWLQGGDGAKIIDEPAKKLGFKTEPGPVRDHLVALSRLMALGGRFTVVGMDQLDNVLSPASLSPRGTAGSDFTQAESDRAEMIVKHVSQSLGVWVNSAASTLTVAAVLADGWDKLQKFASATGRARYDQPLHLEAITTSDQARRLVERRLEEPYRTAGLVPPYPSWPFHPEAFEGVEGLTPRELLRRAGAFISRCADDEEVSECRYLGALPGDDGPEAEAGLPQRLQDIDRHFDSLLAGGPGPGAEPYEMAELAAGLKALVEAARLGFTPAGAEAVVIGDDSLPSSKTVKHLYEYLRFFRDEAEAPLRLLTLWILNHPNARSFQSQLKSAMVVSGADPELPSRRLGIIRAIDLPGGPVTKGLLDEFHQRRGEILSPSARDLALMAALVKLQTQFPAGLYRDWVLARQPAMEAAFAEPLLRWLTGQAAGRDPAAAAGPDGPPEAAPAAPAEAPPAPAAAPPAPPQDSPSQPAPSQPAPPQDSPSQPAPSQPAPPQNSPPQPEIPQPEPRPLEDPGWLLIGQRDDDGSPVKIAIGDLLKHAVILASSGAGKTVVIKRLVEEAALNGVPSIVVDGAGDMALLGMRRPSPPEGWLPGDAARAEEYFRRAETVIWTPELSKGNPMSLEWFPDFDAAQGDPDERRQMLDSAIESLEQFLGKKSTVQRRAILRLSLEQMIKRGWTGFDGLLRVARNPPPDIQQKLGIERRHITALGAELTALNVVNPALTNSANHVDAARLIRSPAGKTRISVISLRGLVDMARRQAFVKDLVSRVFEMIFRSPSQGLKGLLVIDEAKDFVGQAGSACKKAIVRFADQARKYGFGLILASQEFKSLDHNVINNCGTMLAGRQQAPISIQNVKEHIGPMADDVNFAALGPGRFFLMSPSVDQGTAVDIRTAMSLSLHAQPLELEALLEAAAGNRDKDLDEA